jgi:hypothetical protein
MWVVLDVLFVSNVVTSILMTRYFEPSNRPFYVACTELRYYTGPTDHSRNHEICSCWASQLRSIFDGPGVGDDGTRLADRNHPKEGVYPNPTGADGSRRLHRRTFQEKSWNFVLLPP